VYDSELFTVLEIAGEILPLNMENGEKLYVLNVLECVNLLNSNKTIWHIYDSGEKGHILQYSFYDSVSESSLFKIPETSKVEILTYSGIKDDTDEFYTLYKKMGFTGLIFRELYPLLPKTETYIYYPAINQQTLAPLPGRFITKYKP